MPQLDPTWFASQLFWLVVSFATLYVLLSRMVLPPLQNVMGQRKSAVEIDLAAAQEFKRSADAARQSYEKTLADSKSAAHAVLAEAELLGKERAAKSMKQLDEQISTKIAGARKDIEAKKLQILSEVEPKTAEFSALIAEKLTGVVPSEAQVRAAITAVS